MQTCTSAARSRTPGRKRPGPDAGQPVRHRHSGGHRLPHPYISASLPPTCLSGALVVGQDISVLDQPPPSRRCRGTGQPWPDLFLSPWLALYLLSLFPRPGRGERVIGVVGTITVRNLGRLKRCSPSSATRPPASGASTRIWPGVTAATAWRIL